MRKTTPLELYIFWKEISRGIQICYGIKGRMTGWKNMDLEIFSFFGPQNHEKIGHQIFVLHPTSFLMPYLNSSWNFLSENVYFWYGRAKISQVKLSWSSRGAKFSESGDVTLRVASSKHMAIYPFEKRKKKKTLLFFSVSFYTIIAACELLHTKVLYMYICSANRMCMCSILFSLVVRL